MMCGSQRLSRMHWRVVLPFVMGALFVTATDATAQLFGGSGGRRSRALMVDSVVGLQDYFAESRNWETQTIIDTFATVEIAPGLQASVRPLVWRQATGNWKSTKRRWMTWPSI